MLPFGFYAFLIDVVLDLLGQYNVFKDQFILLNSSCFLNVAPPDLFFFLT